MIKDFLSLRLILLIGVIFYLGAIFFLLKKKRLSVRYSILWLASGFVMLLFVCVPYIVFVLRALTGVEVVSNLVFLLVNAFMLFILLSLSAAASTASEQIKKLAQSNALLEKRVRELEEKLAAPSDSDDPQ